MSTNLAPDPAAPDTRGFSGLTGFLLARLGRAVTRQYRAALAPIGLRPPQTPALLALSENGAMSQQALGAKLDIDASNLVALLNDLEGAGLVTRRRDPEDRRRHLVEISTRGSKLICEVERAAARIDDEFFEELSEDERAQLHELLARVSQGADIPPKDAGADDC
jgi:DNA-binding MarR family transcriptional regulator